MERTERYACGAGMKPGEGKRREARGAEVRESVVGGPEVTGV